jgi:hypothetical protein
METVTSRMGSTAQARMLEIKYAGQVFSLS